MVLNLFFFSSQDIGSTDGAPTALGGEPWRHIPVPRIIYVAIIMSTVFLLFSRFSSLCFAIQDLDGICSNLAVVSPFLYYYLNFSSNMSECWPRVKLCDSGSFFKPCAFQSLRAIRVIYEYFSRDISIFCWESCVHFCSVSFGADRAALACLCSVNSVCRETYVCGTVWHTRGVDFVVRTRVIKLRTGLGNYIPIITM